MPFDYNLDNGTIDFRQHPDLYRVGKGEQGVLLEEPNKSEMLPREEDTVYQGAKALHTTLYGK